MKIKASSINNLTDARYFAAWNVEWLGFCLEIGQPNYSSPKDIQEIKEWLVGPKIVGEFGLGHSSQEILAAIELLNLDAVQLSRFVADSVAKEIKNVAVFKEWILQDLAELALFADTCQTLTTDVDYFLLDLSANGLSWAMIKAAPKALELLQNSCQQYPIILSIDCPANQIEELIAVLNPYGLSIAGGEEEKVGVKSFEAIDELFEVLEEMELIGF